MTLPDEDQPPASLMMDPWIRFDNLAQQAMQHSRLAVFAEEQRAAQNDLLDDRTINCAAARAHWWAASIASTLAVAAKPPEAAFTKGEEPPT